MVFWNALLYDTPCTKKRIPSPTGSSAECAGDLEEIKTFLHAHFRMHPDVIIDIPLDACDDTILMIRDRTRLVGCIRYHHIGYYENKPIHVVDWFCVHPEWRGKGVGDYLLHELHHMMDRRPCAIFVKEGNPLSILPYYESAYVYRMVDRTITPNVRALPLQLAYRLMDTYQTFRPCFMIRKESSNQEWKFYRNGIHHILACVQDTYQTLYGKRMGWITAWIESPGITDAMRGDASYQISNHTSYDLIWMDKNHIGSAVWIYDGPFYWYTYQWTPSITVGRSYCFIQ
jgi:GNAT superfamily N-acetyltransferase